MGSHQLSCSQLEAGKPTPAKRSKRQATAVGKVMEEVDRYMGQDILGGSDNISSSILKFQTLYPGPDTFPGTYTPLGSQEPRGV